MVKGEIKRQDGTTVIIEGSEAEVARLLAMIVEKPAAAAPQKRVRSRKTPVAKESKSGKVSAPDVILELKEEGFFDQPKGLAEVKAALAARGMIYEITALSGPVLKLVRKRSLGRIKEENKWRYVKR